MAPLTDFRPAFEVRTGALTTRERLLAFFEGARAQLAGVFVPEALREITAELLPEVRVNDASAWREADLVLNGRCALPPEAMRELAAGEALVEESSGDVIAAACDERAARVLAEGGFAGEAVAKAGLRARTHDARALISRPWHVRTFRDAALRMDLDRLTREGPAAAPPGTVSFGLNALRVASSARIYPGCVFDLVHGPVYIDEDAVLRPGVFVHGPAYVGPETTLLDRCLIKASTSVGPNCKVAGEVGGTIFQAYSNKAHDGHLGDSWVGEWVNFGAGTMNSNLLNTYGEVIAKAAPGMSNERTGETFLGAIVGDHVKFAIGTRIMTGAVLHSGSMFAQTPPISGCVGPFTWATDAGPRVYRFEKFTEVMLAAMARRKVRPSEAYMRRLASLHGAAASTQVTSA